MPVSGTVSCRFSPKHYLDVSLAVINGSIEELIELPPETFFSLEVYLISSSGIRPEKGRTLIWEIPSPLSSLGDDFFPPPFLGFGLFLLPFSAASVYSISL